MASSSGQVVGGRLPGPSGGRAGVCAWSGPVPGGAGSSRRPPGRPGGVPLARRGARTAKHCSAARSPIHCERPEPKRPGWPATRRLAAQEIEAGLPAFDERTNPWLIGEFAFWAHKIGVDWDCPGRPAEPYAFYLDGHPEKAAAAWAALGCPYDEAQALADSDDETHLRRALSIFQSLEAHSRREVVAERLRAMGARRVSRGPRSTTRAQSRPASATAKSKSSSCWPTVYATPKSQSASSCRPGRSTTTFRPYSPSSACAAAPKPARRPSD